MANHLRTRGFDFNPITLGRIGHNSMKYLVLIMTLMFPIVSPAQNSIRDDVQAAERSPLFQQRFSSAQISARGLDNITLHNGVELHFKTYTDLTRLDQDAKFKPLMNTAIVNQYLRSKPTYTESILQLQDRLIVDRTMTVSMKRGTCQQRDLPVSVSELCFVTSTGPIPPETQTYLVHLREQLNQAQPNTRVKDGMTARQLSNMNDEELLEVLLNSDDREIKLVSVLPTEVYHSPTRTDLWNTNKRLKASDFGNAQNTSMVADRQLSSMPLANNRILSAHHVFPKQYFLTGFTLGREITDTFEIQIAAATLFTDRYFVRFEYEFSTGVGLRFPFSVSVESQTSSDFGPLLVVQGTLLKDAPPSNSPGRPVPRKPIRRSQSARADTLGKVKIRDHRATAVNPAEVMAGENTPTTAGTPITHADITISVAPVNVESNGSPAYPAVNLPLSKYFDGKEFVLKFHAGCKFKASIPGEDINLSCPTVDFDRSRDIDPVIGTERAKLATLWLDGSVTGLSIQAWAGKASLDFGIESNLTNGRISLNANGFNNTLIDNVSTHSFVFQDTNTQEFKIANSHNTNAAFNLDTPRYGFDLELLPVARATFSLDLGIKTLNKTLGPYSLDALSLTVGGFSMGHHEGTVRSHIYGL